ncbi:MAG: putative manganese-dependent inorganic diphosphatase [Fusobacteriaceae bacterium]
MDHILAFGHKNPDTDSICSAIAFSALKIFQGEATKPYRLGEVSKETKFVLERFRTPLPALLKTVSAQISDLTRVEKKTIDQHNSLKEALDIMTEENISSLPVVDKKRHLKGMIHISDIANTYLNLDHEDLFSKYGTTYENLKAVINGIVISGKYPKGAITGTLKAVSEIANVVKGDIVVTTSMVDSIDRSIQAGASVIIICCEASDFISPRTGSDCAIVRVHSPLFKTIRLISQSISINSIMRTSNFYSFKTDDFLHEIKDIMKESNQSNFPVVDKKGEVYGTIRTKNLINFTRKKIVLLDHNEKSQSVDGISDARIVQVVDHHKFGNFETNEPVKIYAETVGCTCTLVYDLYKEAKIVPEKKVAGLMLSAILSDTLLFKSPTCTEKDKLAAQELSVIAEITDCEKYGMEMLIAGTSLDDMSASKILHADMKEFSMNGYNLAIAQVNTVDIEGVLKRKEEIQVEMRRELEEQNYSLSILVITDIVNSGSLTLVIGEFPEIVERAFNVKVENNSAWLEGVVSRKKQIVPFLMAATQSMED